jgi:hypothetical protein
MLNRGAQVTVPPLRNPVFEEGLPVGLPGNTFFLQIEKSAVDVGLVVDYQTRAGTATSDLDFQSRSGSVTIPAGETTGLVPVTILEDALLEGDENFFIDFTLPDRWSANTLTTEIVIGDSTNSVVAVQSNGTVSESDGTIDVAISKSKLAAAVQVDFQLISDSALQGSDFVAASGTLSLPANTSSVVQTIEVVADGIDEAEESFRLVLSNPVNAVLGNDTCQITLEDSDDLVMTMTLPEYISENAGTIPLTFRLSGQSARSVFGNYRLTSGTALLSSSGDVDAGDGVLEQVTFTPGQTELVVQLPVVDDLVAEQTEHFTATFVSAGGAQLGGERAFLCRIWDDDAPQLTLLSSPAAEQVGSAQVSLQLSNTSTLEVRAMVDLVDREALAGEDYSRVGFPKEVVIPAGNLASGVTIPLIDDARVEPTETFYARITSVTGARHDGSDHAVRIRSSDQDGGFWLEPTSEVANAGTRTRVFQGDVILGAPAEVDAGMGGGGMGGMGGMGGGPTDGSVVSLDLVSGGELWNAMLDFGDGFQHATFGRDGLAVNAEVVAAGETDYSTPTFNFLGGVHVFNRTTGALVRTLTASQPRQNTQFGVEVEICGRYLVTSAPNEMDIGGMGGGMVGTGVLYAFDVNTGVEIARVPSPDSGHTGTFGAALAISPRHIVVGSPTEALTGFGAGKVYVYDTVSQAFLYAITPPNGGGGGDAFGQSLVLAGDRLYVGAPGATFIPTNPMEVQTAPGAVYVYELGESEATLLREHYPEAKEYGAEFGDHLALYGTTLFVGAPGLSGNSGLTQRAGAVIGLDAETGEELITIISPIPQPNDEFGRSFDYFGSQLVVGVPGGGTKGGAYRFTLDRPGYAGWLDRAAQACEQVEINFSSGLHPLVAYALGADELGAGAAAPRGERSLLGPVAVAFEAPALPPVDVAYIIEQSCTLQSDDWAEIARFQSDLGWTGSSFVSFEALPDDQVRVLVHAVDGEVSPEACFLRLNVQRLP